MKQSDDNQRHWPALLREATRTLCTHDLLTPRSGWIAGVSGGPDSVILLRALLQISAASGLDWRIHVAHLNHQLRGGESDADERYVRKLADSLGLTLHVECQPVAEIAARRGKSIETAARQVRYRWFERLAVEQECELVAVGHHADDQAETVLHNLCRGSGLRGVAGMRPDRPIRQNSPIRLIRPLLDQRRSRILAACDELGLQPRHDATNARPHATRNRIRNEILPALRQSLNPQVDAALTRFADNARQWSDLLDSLTCGAWQRVAQIAENHEISLDRCALLAEPDVLQAEIVREAFRRLLGRPHAPDARSIRVLLRLVAQSPQRGTHSNLANGLRADVRGERILLHRADPPDWSSATNPVVIEAPGRTQIAPLELEIVAIEHNLTMEARPTLEKGRTRRDAWLDQSRLEPPLVARPRRPGDAFRPLNAPGSKSVSDFLTDRKVPRPHRERMFVVCDRRGVVWLAPLQIDDRVKLTADTADALHLRLRPSPAAESVS